MKIKTLLIASLLFTLCAGNVKAQNSSVTLPHNQDFESESVAPWTYIPGSQWSGIKDENEIADIADKDNYLFYFAGSNSDSYLISPELDGTQNGLRFQFDYTNYFLEPEPSRFRVGYSTFTADLEDFVWGETITAVNGDYEEETGDGDWATFVSDFPEGVRYVAINVLPNSSANLYVDNLSITETTCALPAMFQVTATTSTSISLGWQGNNDSYDVQYSSSRQEFDFESGFGEWTSFGGDKTGTWLWDEDEKGHESDYCVYSTLSDPDVEDVYFDNYLVSPCMTLSGNFSFYAKQGGGNWKSQFAGTQFEVLAFAGENISFGDVDNFVSLGEKTALEDWAEVTFSFDGIDGIEGEMGHVIIRHINDVDDDTEEISYLLIDDFVILEWETTNGITDLNYTKTGLNSATEYVFRMRGNTREAHSSWTDVLNVKTFPTTTPTSYTFTTAGDWNKPSNWANMYIPQQVTDNVTINAAAIVPEGCVAKGNININTLNGGSITIRDGGQLYTETENGVNATIKKRITRYTKEGDTDPDNEIVADGWHFISYPVKCNAGGDDPTGVTVTNMINTTSTYDLYLFDPNEELEWRNYKDEENSLKLITGHGYLYANEEDVTLKFTGSLNYIGAETESMSLENGWNLVGNPFAYNTYPSVSYYRMNAEGTAIEATEHTTADAVAPCTGIIVYNDGENPDITFSKDASKSTKGNLKFTVAQKTTNRGVSSVADNAIVSFNEGCQLEKFYFGKQSANLYIPQGNKEYAITYSNKQGEVPLNFVAKEGGTYTINVTTEVEEMIYLHLIDNMTGADIDLLQEPEYTFEARTTDYASRFRVVFATNSEADDDDETFAFNSNGTWIVTNEGQATLQVVDMMGRMLSSESIDGSAAISLNQPAGIYMLRLINGNGMKVQKVVVK